ncbi:tryptophan biosynthesis modulator TrpM [Streptomyces pinistramenti]|uniref:tryptophan biosynthesis modulator TrpM n=1 Tax=Streptomyces pinistramenti TaxID=2884812 RepID=UPI003557A815
MTAAATGTRRPARDTLPGPAGARALAAAVRLPYPVAGPRARTAASHRAGARPSRCALPPWHRGCRAPARRIHGRRVRYHIGSEPGQINGMRWRRETAG